MNQIKKIIAAILALTLLLSLAACGNSENSAEETTEAPVSTETTVATETEETEAATVSGTVYTINVVDEAGSPIAGALVQMCLESCYPGMTDANGTVVFNVDEADYKVSFLSLPAGYTYSTEEENFYFADGSFEMTITLKAAE